MGTPCSAQNDPISPLTDFTPTCGELLEISCSDVLVRLAIAIAVPNMARKETLLILSVRCGS